MEREKKALRTETKHFTTGGQAVENAYGPTWAQAVREYLRTGHKEGGNEHEVTASGMTYKVLKRSQVTVFYDAEGNTLFDVENKRLEQEHARLMNDGARTDAENADPDSPKAAAKEPGNDTPGENGMPADTASAKRKAKEKLEKELKAAKDKNFADPVIGHLLERCEEDEGLAQDVAQDHKAWKKCLGYIYGKARKQAADNRAAARDDGVFVPDDVVFEWAEDYYHEDDKAEEEKKAAQEAKKKSRQKKKAANKETEAQEKHGKTASAPAKEEGRPKKSAEPKKSGKELEGQIDLFSMI